MSDHKTERATVLQESNLTIDRKVCLAAADYKKALQNIDFAAEYGGIDAFRHDLFLFIEQWESTL